MTPSQMKLYTAICTADPECRTDISDDVLHDSDGDYFINNTYVTPLVEAAIRDHLHTQLEKRSTRFTIHYAGAGRWNVLASRGQGPLIIKHESKLDALLAVHATRLGIKEIEQPQDCQEDWDMYPAGRKS